MHELCATHCDVHFVFTSSFTLQNSSVRKVALSLFTDKDSEYAIKLVHYCCLLHGLFLFCKYALILDGILCFSVGPKKYNGVSTASIKLRHFEFCVDELFLKVHLAPASFLMKSEGYGNPNYIYGLLYTGSQFLYLIFK